MEKINYEQLSETLNECISIVSSEKKIMEKELEIVEDLLDNCIHGIHTIFDSKVISNGKEPNDQLYSYIFQTTNSYKDRMSKLKEAYSKKDKIDNFTVTLYGRTKVGKSTLKEFLTKGDGNTIGKGGQNTTKKVIEGEWNSLRVLDVPGNAAANGEKEKEVADQSIDETDLLIYMFNTDSQQNEELDELIVKKKAGKQVLIVLNHKNDLSDDEYRDILIEDCEKEMTRETHKGHLTRIGKYLKDNGIEDIKIIIIHAQSAFLSLKETDLELKNRLYALSNIQELIDYLIYQIKEKGTFKKLVSYNNEYRVYLNETISLTNNTITELSQSINESDNIISDYSSWLKKFEETSKSIIEEKWDAFFNVILLSVQDFVEKNINNKQIGTDFEKMVIENDANQKKEEINSDLINLIKEKGIEIHLKENDDINHYRKDENIKKKSTWLKRVLRIGGVAINIGSFALPAYKLPIAITSITVGGINSFMGNRASAIEKHKKKLIRIMETSLQQYKEECIHSTQQDISKNIIDNIRYSYITAEKLRKRKKIQTVNELEKLKHDLNQHLLKLDKHIINTIYFLLNKTDINDYVISYNENFHPTVKAKKEVFDSKSKLILSDLYRDNINFVEEV